MGHGNGVRRQVGGIALPIQEKNPMLGQGNRDSTFCQRRTDLPRQVFDVYQVRRAWQITPLMLESSQVLNEEGCLLIVRGDKRGWKVTETRQFLGINERDFRMSTQ